MCRTHRGVGGARFGDQRRGEHGLVGCRADHDDVGSGDSLGKLIETNRDPVDPFGERRATVGGAVDNQDLGAA